MKIVWSDEALNDLRAIHDFIGRDSELYASQIVERLISRIEQVSAMPTRGHPVHEFPKLGLRETLRYKTFIGSGPTEWLAHTPEAQEDWTEK